MKRTKTLQEIIALLKMHEREFHERYGIKNIGIFGSYLRGEESEKSDIDLLVEFDADAYANIGLLKFIEIEDFLCELLGIKVDLVEKTALKPRIRKRILAEVIYL